MHDEKDNASVQMEEKKTNVSHNAPPVSAFAALTRAQCVRKFWRLYGTGLAVCIAGL